MEVWRSIAQKIDVLHIIYPVDNVQSANKHQINYCLHSQSVCLYKKYSIRSYHNIYTVIVFWYLDLCWRLEYIVLKRQKCVKWLFASILATIIATQLRWICDIFQIYPFQITVIFSEINQDMNNNIQNSSDDESHHVTMREWKVQNICVCIYAIVFWEYKCDAICLKIENCSNCSLVASLGWFSGSWDSLEKDLWNISSIRCGNVVLSHQLSGIQCSQR